MYILSLLSILLLDLTWENSIVLSVRLVESLKRLLLICEFKIYQFSLSSRILDERCFWVRLSRLSMSLPAKVITFIEICSLLMVFRFTTFNSPFQMRKTCFSRTLHLYSKQTVFFFVGEEKERLHSMIYVSCYRWIESHPQNRRSLYLDQFIPFLAIRTSLSQWNTPKKRVSFRYNIDYYIDWCRVAYLRINDNYRKKTWCFF